MASSFLDLTGLSHFKEKLLVKVQAMIDASAPDSSRKTEVIQQLVAFYNAYNGTALDYRDYLDATDDEVANALYALGTNYLGS